MSRWSSLFLSFVVVLSLAAVGCAWRQQGQKKREDAYQVALQTYSEELKPGMTRKQVEDYLHGKSASFRQMCCVEERTAFTDLLRIGKEGHPWYCEEHDVYLAFQFAAVEPHDPWKAFGSDTLKRITVFHWLEGCL